MKTLLIPFDFTETSTGALAYAAGFCRQFDYRRIILLKSFYDTIFDEVVMSAEYSMTSADFRMEEHERIQNQFEAIEKEFRQQNVDIDIVSTTSELPLVRAISIAIDEFRPRAILMGSDTNRYDNDSYVSEHVIQIARISPVHVIIVPAGQQFEPVKEALIPIDEFTSESLSRIWRLTEAKFFSNVHFNILGLKNAKKARTVEQSEPSSLQSVPKDTSYNFYWAEEQEETMRSVLKFLRAHPVQLIVALPGKYSFLYRLTHRSLQDAMCSNTDKPVLIIKQPAA